MDKQAHLYKTTFESDTGEQVLAELRTRFFDQASYTKQDPYHTAYLEGQREVIRYINAVLKRRTEETNE